MSDISIPGLTSRYNTSEVVDGLVEAERSRLTSMEDELSAIEEERGHWQNINRNLASLQSSVKTLFSFESPFNEKVVTSSNEALLTATAERTADLADYSLRIIQTAKADRFLSTSMDREYRVEGGLYGFQVGDEEQTFRFRGGKLQDFARKLNEQMGDLVRATVVRDTADTEVLLIEAIPTGASNRMFFLEESEQLALDTGMIRQVPLNTQDVSLQSSAIEDISVGTERVISDGQEVTLQSQGRIRLDLDENFPIEDGTILEIQVRLEDLDDQDIIPQEPDPPSLPNIPGIEYQGIQIQSASSNLDLPPWENPPPPPRVDDLKVIAFGNADQTFIADEVRNSQEYQTIQIPLKDYLSNLDFLELFNPNTHRNVHFQNIRVYNPDQVRGFEAVNPVDSAMDALIDMNGIEVRRESNEIDDLIPGVTLNLHRAGDEDIDLEIEPDLEAAKNSLIEFVYHYNNAMTRILILSQDNRDIIDEIEYFDDEQREQALEDLGDLRGNLTLMQIKNRLQSIITAPYETRAGSEMVLLSQLGISSNETGGGFNAAKLRGYLEFDENRLDQALEGDILAIKDLFGTDSDGDLLMDSGIGVELDNYLRAFTQTDGIIDMRDSRLEDQIASQNDEIEDFKGYLEDYEQDLRIEYGNMEGMLNQLESSSSALDNMFNNQD